MKGGVDSRSRLMFIFIMFIVMHVDSLLLGKEEAEKLKLSLNMNETNSREYSLYFFRTFFAKIYIVIYFIGL